MSKFLRLASALALLGMVDNIAFAQERAAAGAIETQMTWTALTNLVNAANTKSDAVNSRVNQVVVCGDKGWVYAAGKPGADSQGCKEPAVPVSVTNNLNTLNTTTANLSTHVTRLIQCNAQGMLFNGSACIATAGGFKLSSVSTYGSGAYSSNKIVTSGWHTLCVLGFNHNDSNFWLSAIQGPNAQGKYIWQASRGAGGAEPILKCMD